jgi:copper(I)-binding protein
VFAVIWRPQTMKARKDSDVRLQNRRVLGGGVLALAAALVLTGCGAGQIAQTAGQEPAVNGAYAQAGALAIRDAALQFPPNGEAYTAGSPASLMLTIVNETGQDDELLGVTSDAASGAVIQGSKIIVSRNSLVVTPSKQTGATGGDAASVTSTPSSPASPTSPATTSSGSGTSAPASSTTTTTSTSTSAPVTTSSAPVAVGKASIVLQGLKQAVWPGQNVRVTFTFRDAGSVTVDLPIASPSGDVHAEAARN